MLAKKSQGTRKKGEKTGGCLPKAKSQSKSGEGWGEVFPPAPPQEISPIKNEPKCTNEIFGRYVIKPLFLHVEKNQPPAHNERSLKTSLILILCIGDRLHLGNQNQNSSDFVLNSARFALSLERHSDDATF